jgi:hypothetical protein
MLNVRQETFGPIFNWTPIYSGKATKVKLKGRLAGSTYYYRVKATLSGYSDSTWVEVEDGCTVPFVFSTKHNAGGTLTMNGEPAEIVTIPVGETRTLVITPDEGYHIVSVVVDGVVLVDDSGEKTAPYSHATAYNVTVPAALDLTAKKHKIAVKFAVNSYNATSTAGAGGKITPAGPKVYKNGKQALYTITPDKGYRIANVLVNAEAKLDLPPSGLYKMPLKINENKTIEATFQLE